MYFYPPWTIFIYGYTKKQFSVGGIIIKKRNREKKKTDFVQEDTDGIRKGSSFLMGGQTRWTAVRFSPYCIKHFFRG